MGRIVIIGLQRNTNLGDPVIADCTSYLVKKALMELNLDYQVDCLDMMEDSYETLSSYDFIVFAGGGIIKYRYQKFYQYIDEITKIAQANDIPVIMVGVGVEGYDQQDEKCQILKKALNRKCVKSITTRDDIECLNSSYIERDDLKGRHVADPAVFSSDIYGIAKNKESKVVGLGVVREGIFRSNGIDIGREELFELWSGIIEELEKRCIDWKIFTNGWSSDMKFAINLMKFLKREEEMDEKVIPVPENAPQLVNKIANFKGVIAGRLHANIISYSLDIPAIQIVWNDKLKMWSETIGYPEDSFEVSRWDSKAIVEQLLDSMNEGYRRIDMEEFKKNLYLEIKDTLASYL